LPSEGIRERSVGDSPFWAEEINDQASQVVVFKVVASYLHQGLYSLRLVVILDRGEDNELLSELAANLSQIVQVVGDCFEFLAWFNTLQDFNNIHSAYSVQLVVTVRQKWRKGSWW
jgi:hypothetical protein